MISGPQGDFKHTGHVGLDGAYFGDVSFLGDKVQDGRFVQKNLDKVIVCSVFNQTSVLTTGGFGVRYDMCTLFGSNISKKIFFVVMLNVLLRLKQGTLTTMILYSLLFCVTLSDKNNINILYSISNLHWDGTPGNTVSYVFGL